MEIFLFCVISVSLLIAIQVSVTFQNTNQQQQIIIINQTPTDESSDFDWLALGLVAIGLLGILAILS